MAALQAALREKAQGWAGDLADTFCERARAGASRRTGEMAESIGHDDPVASGDSVQVRCVADSDHARFNNDGVGIYGPTGQRIEGSPLLAFDWPAAGGVVIVRSVAGYPGTHFWDNAVAAWPDIVRSL